MRSVRTIMFVALAVALAASMVYGIAVGDFRETVTNGVMICLTCIGVA
ncbi:MAG: hypothetical protein GF400_03905 [Candidatus Eisenbacteria bacterium]|nr:hypothetical protein [Candidatus Eisenbacteria bacterium]